MQQSSITRVTLANPHEVQWKQPYTKGASRYMGEQLEVVNVSQVKRKISQWEGSFQ